MYKKSLLPNGVRIITKRLSQLQSVAIGIWIKAGGRHEESGNKGISHYLEHLLFKGTKKYSCHSIKESIEGVGGSLNAFTSEEVTCYLVKLPSKHFAIGMDILSDMVVNPLLPADEVEKERTVILEEIKMYKDLPQSYVYELLDQLLWPHQPLGMGVIGFTETVQALSRNDLYEYQKKQYTAPNIVVSVVGNLNHDDVVSRVKKNFSVLAKASLNTFVPAVEKQSVPLMTILEKDTEQTHMALGFHSFPRDHELRHALGLLHVILGANMSSRLFNEVREKRGLAYEIGTQVKRYHDTGAFIVHAGIDNNKVCQAMQLIFQELARTSRELVSPDEFKRAKEFYLGQLAMALEDTMDYMLWMGESLTCTGKVYTLQEMSEKVQAVKRDEIRAAARQIFCDARLSAAFIGPLKDKEECLKDVLHLR